MRRAKIERNGKAIKAMPNSGDISSRVRLKLDRQCQTPIYRQIYKRICDAIARGVLRPGERLPSTRTLASQLATSRGTVDLAYSMLSGEGYVLSLGPAGTMVASAPIGDLKPSKPSIRSG